MEDVLDVYCRPYNSRRPVICFDEVSKQIVSEVRKPIPAKPGRPMLYDFEYHRKGVCNVFMCCEPLKGWRDVKVTERRTKVDWAKRIKELVDVDYSDAEKIVLVMDNLNTHTPSSLYEEFEPKEAKRLCSKLEIHYTPKHGSWLNIAEIELSVLSRQCLNQRFSDKVHLIKATKAWQESRNTKESKVDWHFTTEDARIKLKRLYPTIHD